MTTHPVNVAHDRFFRIAFSHADVTAGFIRHYLPPEVSEHFSLGALQAVKGSFVDEALQAHVSDLLYQVPLRGGLKAGQKAYIYLLFEHKSYHDRYAAFQLLRYMVRIWQEAPREHGQLPLILPLVLYHGEDRWYAPQNFAALLEEAPWMERQIPDYEYLLCDLSTYATPELVAPVRLRVTMLALQHVHDSPRWDEETILDLARVAATLALRDEEFLMAVIHYLAQAAGGLKLTDLQGAIERELPEKGERLMATIAEQWIKEGREEGLKEGLIEGLQKGREEGVRAMRESVAELVKIRFGEVSPRIAHLLNKTSDLDFLKQLLHQAALAESLEAFECEL